MEKTIDNINILDEYTIPFLNGINQNNDNFKNQILSLIEFNCNEIRNNYENNISEIKTKMHSHMERFEDMKGNKNNLEEEIERLRNSLLKKNKELLELETEKQNWNKVSYTKFLDKQLKEKKEQIEVMQLRLNNSNKQNNELRIKNNELKAKIKLLCEDNNINLSDDLISISESIAETSNIDLFNEQSKDEANQNIKINIQEINENESNNSKTDENESNNSKTDENESNNSKTDENESNLETHSSDNDIKEEYEIFVHTNKSGKSKKYLKKDNDGKTYLYKYTSDSNKGDPIGEIRLKNNTEKACFYRKKKN